MRDEGLGIWGALDLQLSMLAEAMEKRFSFVSDAKEHLRDAFIRTKSSIVTKVPILLRSAAHEVADRPPPSGSVSAPFAGWDDIFACQRDLYHDHCRVAFPRHSGVAEAVESGSRRFSQYMRNIYGPEGDKMVKLLASNQGMSTTGEGATIIPFRRRSQVGVKAPPPDAPSAPA